MTETAMKKEFTLSVNDFREVTNKDGIYGLAKNIETIILMDKGSYPNIRDMGVGIEDYQFEFLTINTLDTIKYSIKRQINKYIPTNKVKDVVVEQLENESNNKKSVAVLVTLNKNVDNVGEIVVLMNKDISSNSLESTIFI